MGEKGSQDSNAAFGCSSNSIQARHLHVMECEPDTQFYSWHRCFNHTEGEVDYEDAAECEAEGLVASPESHGGTHLQWRRRRILRLEWTG
eukprot:scaffold3059_cov131-Amphora_coffeaeformis.AAC.4